MPWSSFSECWALSQLLEKAMAPHSSTLAWKIPWTEEPGRLQFAGSLKVGHDWATSLSLSLSLSCIGEGNGNPLQCSCLENPRDGGAWWAAVYGVAQNRTRLKRLSSSSSSSSCHALFMDWFLFLKQIWHYYDHVDVTQYRTWSFETKLLSLDGECPKHQGQMDPFYTVHQLLNHTF